MTMPFHTCSGVECPKCGVFAKERLVRRATVLVQAQRAQTMLRKTFVDSRGFPVERMPDMLLPSVTVVIVHGEPWKIVVHQRSDNGHWALIGGGQEIGESILHCAEREAFEETGLVIAVQGLVCIDSDPQDFALCAYPDGRVVHYTNCTFLASVRKGALRKSEESLAVQWVYPDTLPSPFLPAHRRRLTHALNHSGRFIPVQ